MINRRIVRSRLAERILQISLDKYQVRSMTEGLRLSGKSWGDFYSWKLTQFRMSAQIRHGSASHIRAKIRSADASCYQALKNLPDTGVLLALPHYGHFAHTVVGIADALVSSRKVLVFYDSPQKLGSNAFFDALAAKLFSGNANFEIVHNNRRGMITAVKGLQSGSVVIIMPDVYEPSQEIYRVRFASGSRLAALGTAFLARKTGSCVLPCLSAPIEHGFETRYGTLIDCSSPIASPTSVGPELWKDYAVMTHVLAQLDCLMGANYVPWQYISSNFTNSVPLLDIDREQARALMASFDIERRILEQSGYA